MKDYKYIEDVLERYFDAQTNEAEEQYLKDFFFNEEVPPHLQSEKEMFLQLQAIQVPRGLEEKLNKQINQWEIQEHFAQKAKTSPWSFRLRWIGGIAASILILLSIGSFFQSPTPLRDTCTTPEEAYIHTEKALLIFAHALNKGVKQIEVIQENTNKVEQTIQKQLHKLNNKEL